MSDADAAESKRRAEWLHKNKAHRDWIILSVSEVSVIREELLAVERERDEAMAKYDTLVMENMLEVNKLCKERDEALEELRKLKIILDVIKNETL